MTTTINASTSSGLVVTPDNSGNIQLQYNGVAAPAFSASKTSNQSLNATTETKITFDTEQFDTAGCFASSRFTPTVAGYYQLNFGISFTGNASGYFQVYLWKNGVRIARTFQYQLTTASYNGFPSSYLLYMNGTTDYVEVYVTSQNDSIVYGEVVNVYTYFQGCLLRGA